jgi:hypothetical protein
MDNFQWQPVKGYEGLYEISPIGIRSLRKKNKPLLKLTVSRSGYYQVRLKKNKQALRFYFHRLIALAFIPNPLGKPQVNHLDGDKLNNSLENLQWCTKSENAKHAYEMGLCKLPPNSKKKVLDSCTGKVYESIKDAAKDCEIPYTIIRQMLRGYLRNDTCLQLAA